MRLKKDVYLKNTFIVYPKTKEIDLIKFNSSKPFVIISKLREEHPFWVEKDITYIVINSRFKNSFRLKFLEEDLEGEDSFKLEFVGKLNNLRSRFLTLQELAN